MTAPNPQAQPTPPIAGGPATSIPQTDIPHMGTSQANVANPHVGEETSSPETSTQMPQQAQMPALPPGVTQEAINAAIAHVQQTGNTDGIAPDVLAAACAQIEAQAAAQGVDLNAQATAPANHAEAAVHDKQSTFDQFAQQRDSLKAQVAQQREAMQDSYSNALNTAENSGGISQKQMNELIAAMKDLDPAMIDLINAFAAVSTNPSVLNGIVWIEIIRTLRRLIAKEAQQQIQDTLHPEPS